MSALAASCESTDIGTAIVAVAAFAFLGFFVWVMNR